MDSGFEFLQMGRALLRDPEFVNRMRLTPPGEECGCGCDHVNYCIARMYSREMACHHCVWDELTPGIRREIGRIKQRNARGRLTSGGNGLW